MANTLQKRSASKSIPEVVRRWPTPEAREWTLSFAPEACSHPSILAVVGFGAAFRCDHFTADIDLLVVYEPPKPAFPGRPIEVDIRWYERSQAEKFIREGQELLGWIVNHGELICEKNGYWTDIRREWVGRMPFPSAAVADARVERAWRLHRELAEMGDEDAAREQYLVALTQQARAVLIRKNVYPASRPELPGQLFELGESKLADTLERALANREICEHGEAEPRG